MKHSRQDYMHIQDPKGIIPEDEPVFLLRAQDPAAPFAVRSWAQKVDQLGGDRKMVNIALAFADEMENWPKRKLPDLPDKPPEVEKPPPAPEKPEAKKPPKPKDSKPEDKSGKE